MPGTIGNTNPTKGKRWRDAINRALEKRSRAAGIQAMDELAEKLLTLCDEGDLGALKEFGDRIDGKAVQGVELGGIDGAPVETKVVVEYVTTERARDTATT
jgi:hypothetical protein